jgi:hypothetical protein
MRVGTAGLMTPDGKVLYVACASGTVTPIVVGTDTGLKPIQIGGQPYDMAFGR